jgi:8-oxo-dGTP diphosphatase
MRVVCGLLQRSGLVCITRRASTERAFPNLWEHPGGKIEEGESPEVALAREFLEELGVDVSVDYFIRVERFDPPISPRPILIALYRVTLLHGEPKPIVADELRWVTPQDMYQLQGTPAFNTFNKYLRRRAELLGSA